MTVVFIIILTSIANLYLQNGNSELRIALLSSAIGYALPSPSLKIPVVRTSQEFEKSKRDIGKHGVPVQTLQQHLSERSNGVWKITVRLQTIT